MAITIPHPSCHLTVGASSYQRLHTGGARLLQCGNILELMVEHYSLSYNKCSTSACRDMEIFGVNQHVCPAAHARVVSEKAYSARLGQNTLLQSQVN
jgi:hypothetical protein